MTPQRKRLEGPVRPNRPIRLQIDQIGYWSEVKLDIIREYAKAYSTILSAQQKPALSHLH